MLRGFFFEYIPVNRKVPGYRISGILYSLTATEKAGETLGPGMDEISQRYLFHPWILSIQEVLKRLKDRNRWAAPKFGAEPTGRSYVPKLSGD